MSVKDDLIAARALIDTPEKWGRGWESFTPETPGHPLCILGACVRVNPRNDDHIEALRPFLPKDTHPHFIAFNDDPATTHNDILALFDRAIEAQP